MEKITQQEKKEQRSLKEQYVDEQTFTKNSYNSKICQAKQMYLQKYVWRRINLELWEEMHECSDGLAPTRCGISAHI